VEQFCVFFHAINGNENVATDYFIVSKTVVEPVETAIPFDRLRERLGLKCDDVGEGVVS